LESDGEFIMAVKYLSGNRLWGTNAERLALSVLPVTTDSGMTGDNEAETSYLVYKQIADLTSGQSITEVRIDVYSCGAGAKFAVGVYDNTASSNEPDNLLYNGSDKCVGVFTQTDAITTYTTISCPLDYTATVPANGIVWVACMPDEETHWRVNTGSGVYTDSVYHTTSPSPTTRWSNWADNSPNGTWVMYDDALISGYGGNNIRMGVSVGVASYPDLPNGSVFITSDTNVHYMWNGSDTWNEVA